MNVQQHISREGLQDAFNGRLLFAKVREDPAIERQILEPEQPGRIVLVGSGGCTALSLLAAGNCEVTAVDSNKTQNHLTELKAAALGRLEPGLVPGFLGGHALAAGERLALLAPVAERLGPEARAFWQRRSDWVARGVLQTGVTERFIAAIRTLVKAFVHPRHGIRRLLSARTLDEQRDFYERFWNNRRWRALFHVLLNRFVMRKTLDDRLFLRSDVRSVAGYFLSQFEHGICRIPVATNYFLHHMLTGYYPVGNQQALPFYLARPPSESVLRARLKLVDGSMTGYLRTCAPGSVRGFALSNICEWMSDREISELFTEISRVATNGARVVIRNFLGWTDVPAAFSSVFREQPLDADSIMAGERSLMQRRVLFCRIEKSDDGGAPRSLRTRASESSQN